MVKPLSFKGDKRSKKRKQQLTATDEGGEDPKDLAHHTNETTEDDSWVTADLPTDITGPVVVVLPSTPPTCIACDSTGKVFTSELENLIEGDPGTAEPHDVRQVWVATRVAGSEGCSFKGHHGRYVLQA